MIPSIDVVTYDATGSTKLGPGPIHDGLIYRFKLDKFAGQAGSFTLDLPLGYTHEDSLEVGRYLDVYLSYHPLIINPGSIQDLLLADGDDFLLSDGSVLTLAGLHDHAILSGDSTLLATLLITKIEDNYNNNTRIISGYDEFGELALRSMQYGPTVVGSSWLDDLFTWALEFAGPYITGIDTVDGATIPEERPDIAGQSLLEYLQYLTSFTDHAPITIEDRKVSCYDPPIPYETIDFIQTGPTGLTRVSTLVDPFSQAFITDLKVTSNSENTANRIFIIGATDDTYGAEEFRPVFSENPSDLDLLVDFADGGTTSYGEVSDIDEDAVAQQFSADPTNDKRIYGIGIWCEIDQTLLNENLEIGIYGDTSDEPDMTNELVSVVISDQIPAGVGVSEASFWDDQTFNTQQRWLWITFQDEVILTAGNNYWVVMTSTSRMSASWPANLGVPDPYTLYAAYRTDSTNTWSTSQTYQRGLKVLSLDDDEFTRATSPADKNNYYMTATVFNQGRLAMPAVVSVWDYAHEDYLTWTDHFIQANDVVSASSLSSDLGDAGDILFGLAKNWLKTHRVDTAIYDLKLDHPVKVVPGKKLAFQYHDMLIPEGYPTTTMPTLDINEDVLITEAHYSWSAGSWDTHIILTKNRLITDPTLRALAKLIKNAGI